MNRFIIYLLALGAFLVGTAELIVAGVLNVIAQDLDISIALAGQLITAFSLSFAIGTPIVITLTSRVIILWIGSVFVTGPAIQTYFVQKAPESSNLIISLNTSIIHLGVAIGAGAGGVLTNLLLLSFIILG